MKIKSKGTSSQGCQYDYSCDLIYRLETTLSDGYRDNPSGVRFAVKNLNITDVMFNGIKASNLDNIKLPKNCGNVFSVSVKATIKLSKGNNTWTTTLSDDYITSSIDITSFVEFTDYDKTIIMKRFGEDITPSGLNISLPNVKINLKETGGNCSSSILGEIKKKISLDERISNLKNKVKSLPQDNKKSLLQRKSIYKELASIDKDYDYLNELKTTEKQLEKLTVKESGKEDLDKENSASKNSNNSSSNNSSSVSQQTSSSNNDSSSENENFKNYIKQQQGKTYPKKQVVENPQEQALKEQQQAIIQKMKDDRVAFNNASDATSREWAKGNYIKGSQSLANEYARQGNATAAYATVGIGTALQIGKVLADNARQKREAEARQREAAARQREEARRREELKRKKEKMLRTQKEKFKVLAEKQKNIKKDIIKKRVMFFDGNKEIVSISNKTSIKNQPQYFFMTYTDNSIGYYRENISFPDKIEVYINENAYVNFSPLIAVYPFSNGEFPFLNEIKKELSKQLKMKKDFKYGKFMPWEDSLELAQAKYKAEVSSATESYLNVIFPSEAIININKSKGSGQLINYWEDEIEEIIPKENISETLEEELPAEESDIEEKPIKEEPIDYWKGN